MLRCGDGELQLRVKRVSAHKSSPWLNTSKNAVFMRQHCHISCPPAEVQDVFFSLKTKLTRLECRGSPAAQLLFCPICTCQLINCASPRFPQRSLWSAYQHRGRGAGRQHEGGSTMTSSRCSTCKLHKGVNKINY